MGVTHLNQKKAALKLISKPLRQMPGDQPQRLRKLRINNVSKTQRDDQQINNISRQGRLFRIKK
jgi:hypothetical protein